MKATPSPLLLDDRPLLVLPQLACLIGLKQAIVLQQIHWWLEKNRKAGRNQRDGFVWTYNTYEQWQEQFPFFSARTIERIVADLENHGLLISTQPGGSDRTKWYRVDADALDRLRTRQRGGMSGESSRTAHSNPPDWQYETDSLASSIEPEIPAEIYSYRVGASRRRREATNGYSCEHGNNLLSHQCAQCADSPYPPRVTFND